MSIARMLHADIVCGARDGDDLVGRLERAGILQVIDVHPGLDAEIAALERAEEADSSALDASLLRARQILETFDRFRPRKKGMMQGFFGSPPYLTEAELVKLAATLDPDSYAPRLAAMVDHHDRLARDLAEARAVARELAPWESLDADLAALRAARLASIVPVRATPAQHDAIAAAAAAAPGAEEFAWQEASRDERTVHGAWATLAARRAELEGWVRAAGAAIVRLPDVAGTPREAIARLTAEAADLESQRGAAAAALAAEADANRAAAQALHDDLANRRRNLDVPRSFLATATVTLARGWILERDRPRLERLAAEAGAELVVRPPRPDEAPPVRLENRKLLRPYQILLEMFGLPDYRAFDPTAFVGTAMTLFYAICLGDVGYGLVQVALALLLKRKYRPAAGTRLFLDLFVQLGAAAAVFGLLTWSFFGTSPGWTPGGPKILGIFPLISPTNDFLLIIGLGLGVGVLVQMASIGAGLVNALRWGDVKAAVFDFGAWLVMLAGLQLWAAARLVPGLPPALGTAGLAVTGFGVLVIVAFAGRDAKTIGGRLATGIISLYGIVGAYGIISYFSDVLSFARLAILNLTGAFIAMVGNLLFGIVSPLEAGAFATVAGAAATIVTLPFGLAILLLFHVLNVVLSMQGSFIHSLRLNYLESFGRYYRGGGRPFLPLKREGSHYRFEQ